MSAIDTTNPSTIFGTMNSPTTPGGTANHLLDSTLIGKTIPTNQWWTNSIVQDNSDPIFCYPYTYRTQLNSSPAGLAISYNANFQTINGNQTLFQEINPTFNATMNETIGSRKFMPVGSSNLPGDDLGCKWRWYSGTNYMETYLYRGQTTISIYCNNITPRIDTGGGVALQNFSPAFSGTTLSIDYFKFNTNQATTQNWSVMTPGTNTWNNISSTAISMGTTYTGWLFLTFYPTLAMESAIKSYIGAVVTAGTVNPTISGNNVQISYNYTVSTQITGVGTPLIALLTHHVSRGTNMTPVNGVSWNCLNGTMTGFVGTSFTFNIPLISTPTQYSNAPTGTKLTIVANQLAVDGTWTITNGAPYEGGKEMGKLATLAGVADLLGSASTGTTIRNNLKTGITNALNSNDASWKLQYDTLWSGIMTAADEYGNTNYSDHHFHWGYWLYGAGILSKNDTSWFNTSNQGTKMHLLARDIGNPDPVADTYFPRFRCMDLYEFHSWAHGVVTSGDGKDQESETEAINAYYGLALWGQYASNTVAQQAGQILLSMEVEGIKNYYHMTGANPISNSQITPSFQHRVPGILFMGKRDYATFFDGHHYAIHGIHNFPITPVSSSAHLGHQEWVYDDNMELLTEIYGELPGTTGNSNSWYHFYIQEQGVFQSDIAWTTSQNFTNPDDGTTLTNMWCFIAIQSRHRPPVTWNRPSVSRTTAVTRTVITRSQY